MFPARAAERSPCIELTGGSTQHCSSDWERLLQVQISILLRQLRSLSASNCCIDAWAHPPGSYLTVVPRSLLDAASDCRFACKYTASNAYNEDRPAGSPQVPNSHPLSHILPDLTSNAAWRQQNHAFGPDPTCVLNKMQWFHSTAHVARQVDSEEPEDCNNLSERCMNEVRGYQVRCHTISMRPYGKRLPTEPRTLLAQPTGLVHHSTSASAAQGHDVPWHQLGQYILPAAAQSSPQVHDTLCSTWT